MMIVPKTKADVAQCLQDKTWRKDHLYTIVDESGDKVRYRQRVPQADFSRLKTYCNVILKSRQHGFTSECCIDILDDALFTPNLSCGIIAHTKLDAQAIFDTKIRTPYEALPELIKTLCPTERPGRPMGTQAVKFANGSEIRVAVSFRSATTHRLHISEYGKICAKYPQRAEEIKTGTLPSVHPQLGGRITIESTAEGAAGHFYDLCTQSQSDTAQAQREGRELNRLQYKFHFYSWHQDPKNSVDPLGIVVSDELLAYFEELRGRDGIVTTVGQQAWYAVKRDGAGGLGRLMKREHPSTVDEAFESTVEGAVYGEEMDTTRTEGRIGFYPWIKALPVYTFWDLGYRDATTVVFAQQRNDECRIIDFYSMTGRGAPYHAAQVNAKDYAYAGHHMPHDVMNHEKGTGIVLKDTYEVLLHGPVHVVERPKLKADGIAAVRDIFTTIRFNLSKTKDLVRAMAYYRYDWDEDYLVYSKDPVHDWASHAADAMQTLALWHGYTIRTGPESKSDARDRGVTEAGMLAV